MMPRLGSVAGQRPGEPGRDASRSDLRIGVAGCGRIASGVHLAALARLRHVRVAALAEADRARRERVAPRFPEAEPFDDFRAMIERAELDGVVVCLPPALHAEAAIAAFRAGRHVYLEKPIATSLEEATAVLEAWRSAGTVGMIGFNYRFHPAYRAAREILRSGRIGEPVAVRTVFSSAARPLPAWKRAREAGGGVLLDLGSHHLDLLPFLLERQVREVSASIRSRRSEEDTALLLLGLDGDLPVQSLFCFGTVDEDRIEVHGSSGELSVDRYAGRVEVRPAEFEYTRWRRARGALRDVARGLRDALHPPGEPSYRLALEAFTETVRRRGPGEPGLDAGYRALGVALAAEEAAGSGKTVPVRAPIAVTRPSSQ